MSIQCFIDLDGVLVNLNEGLQTKLGFTFPQDYTAESRKVIHSMWARLAKEYPTFWVDLQPMPQYKELLYKVLTLGAYPYILSATPEPYTGEDDDACRKQKTQWVANHIGQYQAYRTIITKSKLKQNYLTVSKAKYKILIDDHPGNIERWIAAGGIGVHHVDVQSTIEKLEKLKHDCN